MNIITKFVAIIAVIVLVMAGVLYSLGAEKDSALMEVSVDVLMDEDGYWHITYINGSVREVNKLSTPKGNEINVPGMVANVIYEGEIIGYWTSVELDPTVPRNSTKTYNFSIGLLQKPEEEDNLNVSVRLIGFVGEEIQSYKAPVKVEYKS